jgi:hypothetical protein
MRIATISLAAAATLVTGLATAQAQEGADSISARQAQQRTVQFNQLEGSSLAGPSRTDGYAREYRDDRVVINGNAQSYMLESNRGAPAGN